MQYSPEEFNEILNIYKAEAEEIIQELNDGFLLLEKNPEDKTPLKKLFQLAHSLKGASRMIAFNTIQNIAHKIEDILSFWKKDEVKINLDYFQIIYESCDMLTDLIDKSVKQKSDYHTLNTDELLKKLDNLIVSNNMITLEQKTQTTDKYLQNKSVDIKAFILELMFVLEKDDNDENIEEIFLVVTENLNQLSNIFAQTNYSDVKNIIATLLMSIQTNKAPNLEILKEQITALNNSIYKLFKELNISISNNKPAIKVEPQKIIEENDIKITDKFDYILDNLQKIKYEKEFITKAIEILHQILETAQDIRVQDILNKTINILNLISSKEILVDNDCYMVVLQCIYLSKRIFLKEKEEDLNNLDFLVQRLGVVEDMFNLQGTDKQQALTTQNSSNLLNPEILENLKKNLSAFDIQEIKTLRVDTVKLDNLISQTGELLVNGIKTREHILELSKINSKILKWDNESKKIQNYLKYLDKKGVFSNDMDDFSSAFFKRIQAFFINNAKVMNSINNDFSKLYNIISEDDNKLHQSAMEVETIAKTIRVLPLATLFHSFPRMIRDIAKENNKKIDFIISGSDTTVDKKIIEEIKMPLIHILRNSVSHGIECPNERLKNNKNEIGTIKLSAKQIENNVILTIEDDGYGVDLEKVKSIALKKQLLTEDEITQMSNEQIMKLLFLPGFSTEDSVNEISGRGIGLDVVKTKITNLNGEIMIESILNKGCKVTIKVPLSMSTLKTFILSVNKQKYAIPVSAIKLLKQISKEDIFEKGGVNCIICEQHSIPIYFLSKILGENELETENSNLMVIILENQGKQAAFVVDEIISSQEVFQKKLVAPILKIKNISGFTTLSTGEICLIINPYELLRNTIVDKYLPA
jgi:two-component system chemotaxis sensor kinase CheA